jgi:ArsR family transcriptional regulator
MNTNMLRENPEEQIAHIFKALGQAMRILIVLTIGEQESCVCHLETILGVRQARISQHLMALRKAGIVTTKREGRHIYYQLENPQILELIAQTADFFQIDKAQLIELSQQISDTCTCPRCVNNLAQNMICKPVLTTNTIKGDGKWNKKA